MPWAESSRHLLFVLLGSGRRIRTLTYGVRVRCATLTQSRFVPDERFYYIHFPQFVKGFFSKMKNFFLSGSFYKNSRRLRRIRPSRPVVVPAW